MSLLQFSEDKIENNDFKSNLALRVPNKNILAMKIVWMLSKIDIHFVIIICFTWIQKLYLHFEILPNMWFFSSDGGRACSFI